MLSSRSISMATQPMPPSAIATRSPGNRTVQPDQSHSVQACSESWPKTVATRGIRARSQPGGTSPMPDEPTWRHTTVPVSAHARSIGSQWSSKIEGKPI